MEVSQQKRPFKITMTAIVLITVFFCGLSIFSINFIPIYAVKAFFSIILVALSVGILANKKHITLYVFFFFIAGLLFVASAVFSYGYVNVIKPLSILQQIEFSKIIRPQQISSGLSNIGFGISYIALFVLVKPTPFFKKYKWYVLFIFLVSILKLLLGIDSVIEGSSRL